MFIVLFFILICIFILFLFLARVFVLLQLPVCVYYNHLIKCDLQM